MTRTKQTKRPKRNSRKTKVRDFAIPQWAKDHEKEIENISHFVTTILEERESHIMPRALLFDEIKDEFGAKSLREMMNIDSRTFNEEKISELFGVMQRQQRVSIKNGQVGLYVEEKEKEVPLADWCGDHQEDIAKIGEFVQSLLKAERSKQMKRSDVSEEVRDEFGKKYLRKMMKVEERIIAKEKWSELFEALNRGKYLVIIPGKDEVEQVFKLGGGAKEKEKEKEIKIKTETTTKVNPKKRVSMDEVDDEDDTKDPEPPTKKRKLDGEEKKKKMYKTKKVEKKLVKYVEEFNAGKITESKLVQTITKVLSQAKDPLDIHFHFEIPGQKKKHIDVDSDSSDSIPVM